MPLNDSYTDGRLCKTVYTLQMYDISILDPSHEHCESMDPLIPGTNPMRELNDAIRCGTNGDPGLHLAFDVGTENNYYRRIRSDPIRDPI